MPKKTTKPKPSTRRTTKPTVRKTAAPKRLPRPPVPGLLPVPPEVDIFLETVVLKDHPVSDAARQRMRDDLTLQYYYGGEEIAFRRTPQGVEVFAVGLPAVGKFMREMPQELDAEVVMGHPDPW